MMTIAQVCRSQGPRLDGLIAHEGQPVPGMSVLWVIAGLESAFGVQASYVRAEKTYMPGGVYFNVELWNRYGILAASSLGAWQIMFPVAVELGYHDAPWRLIDDPLIGGYWATEYVLRRGVRRGAETLTDVLDSYNSGTHRDAHVPQAYIQRGLAIYRSQPVPPGV